MGKVKSEWKAARAAAITDAAAASKASGIMVTPKTIESEHKQKFVPLSKRLQLQRIDEETTSRLVQESTLIVFRFIWQHICFILSRNHLYHQLVSL